MFKRYTERARRAIFYARHEAMIRGADEIATRDIILGLTHDPHQVGCPLACLHEDAAKLRELLSDPSQLREPSQNREIPLTRSSKISLAYAAEEAERDHRYAIDIEHLLRGVIRANDETGPILAQTGYTLSAVRLLSQETYISNPDLPAPLLWRIKLNRQRILLIMALILFIGALLAFFLQKP